MGIASSLSQRLTKGSKAIVTGAAEIDAALAGLEMKIQRKVIRNALRKGAKRIATEAKANIKLSPSIRTEQLLKSIKVRSMPKSQRSIGMKISTANAPHANLVEYGTKHMPAEPFLRPAGYAGGNMARALMVEDVQQAIIEQTDHWKFTKKASAFQRKIERKVKRMTRNTRKRTPKKA